MRFSQTFFCRVTTELFVLKGHNVTCRISFFRSLFHCQTKMFKTFHFVVDFGPARIVK